MPFLAATPDQDDQSDLAVDVKAGARHQQAEQAPRGGQRHRQHDDRRADPAFELRRQRQEHQQQRQAEGEQHCGARLLQVPRLPAPLHHRPGRLAGGLLLEEFHRLGDRVASFSSALR
jgi:hypothetical protein